jgi:ribosomal protein S18 acetylase RimI-like enzyme
MSLKVRRAEEEDKVFLKEWLSDPNIANWFPMDGEKEVDDSVRIWMDYAVKDQGLTAEWNGVPCGMVVIYLQPFKKLKHTCLLSIIVAEKYRNKGIGKELLEGIMKLAKETYQIEILHLEVYEGNPAKRLYERMGFVSFGLHKHFTKELDGKYRSKVFMQKYL